MKKEIDLYIKSFPKETQSLLIKIRETITKAAPHAVEKMSYGMPTYFQEKNIVHFAAYKNHIGIYPSPKPIEVFKDELVDFKTSKGAIQFRLDKPIPYKLITRIVKYQVAETIENKKESNADFLTALSAPAQRALVSEGINSLKKLSTYTKGELLQLHGIGKSSIPKLENELIKKGFHFKTK